MSLRVNTNVTAFNAYRNLSATDSAVSSSLQKLSSGSRINSAADDASSPADAHRDRRGIRDHAIERAPSRFVPTRALVWTRVHSRAGAS